MHRHQVLVPNDGANEQCYCAALEHNNITKSPLTQVL